MKKRAVPPPKPRRLRKPDAEITQAEAQAPAVAEPARSPSSPAEDRQPVASGLEAGVESVSGSPNTPDLSPAQSERPGYETITDLSANKCRQHGDNAKIPVYLAINAHAGREPNGTCNHCWNFYEAVRINKERQQQPSEPMGAARAISRAK